jgi:hypothetical protein
VREEPLQVTSCRKLVSIMVSFILVPKPFTFIYVVGGLQVFFGIGLEVGRHTCTREHDEQRDEGWEGWIGSLVYWTN